MKRKVEITRMSVEGVVLTVIFYPLYCLRVMPEVISDHKQLSWSSLLGDQGHLLAIESRAFQNHDQAQRWLEELTEEVTKLTQGSEEKLRPFRALEGETEV